MQAMRLTGSAQNPILIADDVPQPKPGPGEVLVRVHAAGITPSEAVWYPTWHTKNGDPRNAAVPSHEFSGVIAELGESVAGFSIGQEVYGMNDWFASGALAEYCVTQPLSIAPKPVHLSHVEAASVPIGALTAWQGLFDRVQLQPGEQALIHGGTGAVGVFAIQLAHWRGAQVTATVSRRNIEFAKELGADRVLDYQAGPFEQQAQGMDVVFDTVGGATLRRSWAVLKQNGRLVTIAAGAEATADEREKQAFFIVTANQPHLLEIARLLDTGKLRPVVDTIAPLARAPEAFTGALERSGRGKLVAVLPANSSSDSPAGAPTSAA